MSLDSKITLGWEGREYKVKMTAGVIMELEDLGIHRMAQKNISLMRPSIIVAFLLTEGGAENIDHEEVRRTLYGQGDETSAKDVADMMIMIQLAIAPEPKKKPTTRSPKKAKKKAKK